MRLLALIPGSDISLWPLAVLGISLAAIVILITKLRVHAFFALIFAAVMLRIELPLLIIWFQGDFTPAYRIVAWLCWVPNLLWADACVRITRPGEERLLRALAG